jgi:hypothetical protein
MHKRMHRRRSPFRPTLRSRITFSFHTCPFSLSVNHKPSLSRSGFAYGVLDDGRYYTIFRSDELCASSSSVELLISDFEHEYEVNHKLAKTKASELRGLQVTSDGFFYHFSWTW